MKRWPLALALAALAISLTLASCEAMFQTNLFSKVTHDQLTTASIADKTPEQIQELIKSDAYLEQLAADDSLKTAALDTLETSYGTMTSGSGDAEGQVAAVVAADILIMTDPNAAAFSAGVIGAIESITTLGDTLPEDVPAKVADIVQGILPYDISSQVAPGAPMPAVFADMLQTFTNAETVFALLGDNLVGTQGAQIFDEFGDPVLDGFGDPTYETDYAYAEGVVGANEALSLAVNAAISTMVTAIVPATDSGISDPAEAIWSALCDPANAATYIQFADSAMDAAYLGNLLSAANFSL